MWRNRSWAGARPKYSYLQTLDYRACLCVYVMYLICICPNIPHRSLSMDLEGKVMGRARSKWDN